MDSSTNQPVQQQPQPAETQSVSSTASSQESQGMSSDTKTIITVLLLIFVPPVGLILMWIWTKWPLWVKILVTIPLVIFLLFIVFAFVGTFVLIATNPIGKIQEAQHTACVQQCGGSQNATCISTCMSKYTYTTPTP